MAQGTEHNGRGLAVVTGASIGLGAALSVELATRGWSLVIDARMEEALEHQARRLRAVMVPGATVEAVVGDITDPEHRAKLMASVARHGRLDLLVNNASVLGPSPQPSLAEYPLDALRMVYEVNVIAPLALTQVLAAWLGRSARPRLLNITSDAAIEPYPGWGGYGSSKAALERITAGWAGEVPLVTCWALDPGDLRTRLHQEAFPDDDISDRPDPETVAPAIAALIESSRPSGRITVTDLAADNALAEAQS
jgi:NAD(P)-dependent dehydrogenase (short-subunit alcohol dehydrogenase family)